MSVKLGLIFCVFLNFLVDVLNLKLWSRRMFCRKVFCVLVVLELGNERLLRFLICVSVLLLFVVGVYFYVSDRYSMVRKVNFVLWRDRSVRLVLV